MENMKAIASETIEKNAIVHIIDGICNKVTTTNQFLTPSSAIFNAKKLYKQGDVVVYEAPNLSDLVDLEISNIRKLMKIEPQLTAEGKKSVRKLISQKATSIQGA